MLQGDAIANVWEWENLQVEENGSIVELTVKNKYSTQQLSKIFVIASELLIKDILKSLAEFFLVRIQPGRDWEAGD